MDAIISGRAGVALLLDEGSLLSFDVDDPDTLLPRRQSDTSLLFGEATDLQFIKNVDPGRAAQELERAFNSASALDLTLILFDAELSNEVRTEAADELERLLSDQQVVRYLENVLYGRPLPPTADMTGALARCDSKRTPNLSATLQILKAYQPAIREVCRVWDNLPAQLFGSDEQKAVFQHVAVREGLFRALAVERANRTSIAAVLLKFLLNPALQALGNHRAVIQEWIKPFRQHHTTSEIRHEATDSSERIARTRKGRRGRRKGINREEVLKNVQSQKALIVEEIRRRDINRALKFVDEMMVYQLENGEPVHAVKSLCDLAIDAKEIGTHTLEIELTERAIKILPDDAWTWAQYGDALLRGQRLTEALSAFEQAESFGKVIIAKSGRAETLKALGRFQEAFAIYDALVVEHPENVLTKNGRAETLRSLGRIKEALTAYDAIVVQHPEDVVAKNGRAETLRALGRLDDALAAYDATITQHPESVVAKSGRAETLRALGRLHEALEAYDAVIADNPEDVFTQNGRAEVLKTLRRLHEALAAYDATITQHPESVVAKNGRSCILAALHRYDEALQHLPHERPITLGGWIGYHISGMILLRMGKIDDAVRIFEQGVRENPWPASREYFRTALAVARLRRRDFTRATQMLNEVTTPLLQPQANVLRLHSFGASGESDRAVTAYQALADKPWSVSAELVAELHRKYILKEEPHHDDEWVFDQEVNTLLLAANQQAMTAASYS